MANSGFDKKESTSPEEGERAMLIQEAAIFGNLKHVGLAITECALAAEHILNCDMSIGWQERLYINYIEICQVADFVTLTSIHYTARGGNHFCSRLRAMLTQRTFTRMEGEEMVFENENCLYSAMMFALNSRKRQITDGEVTIRQQPDTGLKNRFLLTDKMKDRASQEIINYSVFMDTVQFIPYYSNAVLFYLQIRLAHLQQNAPLYFGQLRLLLLAGMRLHKHSLGLDNYVVLVKLGLLTDNLPLPDLERLSPVAWNIYTLDNRYAMGYYLGFDPREGMVPLSSIRAALIHLSTIGVDKYTDLVLKKRHKHPFECKEAGTTTDVDIMLCKIADYSEFDIVCYYAEDCIWTITRPSFEEICKTQLNPYTKRQVPITAIQEMKNRLAIAKMQQLPPASTIRENLTQLMETKPPREPVQEPNHSSDHSLEHSMEDSYMSGLLSLLQIGFALSR